MTATAYPDRCWLTPKADVRPSAIEGRGLFATTPIITDEVVMQLGGQLIDDTTLAGLSPPYSSLTVASGLHLLIDPAHPVRFGNHSCDPSLWHRDATTIVARRQIKPGEEMTIDYATHTGIQTWTMTCRCGSTICRGTVTGQDWQLPQLQRAYSHHWSPPLLERIKTADPSH